MNNLEDFSNKIADLAPSYQITTTIKTLFNDRPHSIQVGLLQKNQQDMKVPDNAAIRDIRFTDSARRFQGLKAVAVIIFIVCLCASYALYGLFFGLGRAYLWAEDQKEKNK